jgi:colanic acid/amylovoran biosynthesis glycosyltransferase
VGVFPTVSETFILNQVTGLIERGHDVQIVAGKVGRPAAIHDDIIRYRLMDRVHYSTQLPDYHPRRLIAALPALANTVLRRQGHGARLVTSARFGFGAAPLELISDAAAFRGLEPFDVLLCHFGPMGVRAARLREAGVVSGRVVTVFHGSDVSAYVRRAGSRAYEHLFRTGDLFLPISDNWRRRLIALGCPGQRIAVHRMGIDCRRFAFAVHDARKGGPLRLVSVGRLLERKGVEYAIRAVAALVAAGLDMEYTIVGDGPLRGVLGQLIRELGLSERVKILGSIAHAGVASVLAHSHVMVAPSVTAANGDMEGIPVAMMEAMASGLPVVSTIHSGIPELIDDGVTGYLVPERDTDALAAKLLYVAENPSEWRSVGEAARQFVLEHHDITMLNEQLAHRLEALVTETRATPSLPQPAISQPVGSGF